MKRLVSVLMALIMVAVCLPVFTFASNSETLPAAVDLSTTIHLPPISNQNNLGSCVSMAVTHMQFTNAYSRYVHEKDPNVTWDPSSGNAKYVFSPRFSFNLAGAGTAWVYESLKEQGTVPQTLSAFSGGVTGAVNAYADVTYDWATQDDYTYNGTSYHIWEEAQKYRIKNYDQVWLNGEQFGGSGAFAITTSQAGQALIERIKSQLNAGNVVVTGGYPNTWTNETPVTISAKGTYGKTGDKAIAYSTGSPNGGHQVAIVGYDDNITCVKNGVTLKGAFKVANSWGTGWMNSGFIWMMYDALNGKDRSAYSALNTSNRTWTMDQMVFLDYRYDLDIGAPSIGASIKLSTTKVNGFSVKLTRADKSTGEIDAYTPFIMTCGHPTNGSEQRNFYGHLSSTPVDGELSFNFNNLISTIPAGKTVDDYYWGFEVSSDNGLTSTVKNVRLLKNGEVVYENAGISESVTPDVSRTYTLDGEKCLIRTSCTGVEIVTECGEHFVSKNVPYTFTLNYQRGYVATKGMTVSVNGERIIDENGVYSFTPTGDSEIRVTGVNPASPATIPINSYNGTNNFENYGGKFVYIAEIANSYVPSELYESGVNGAYTFRITVGGVTYELTPASLYLFSESTLYRIPVSDYGWFPTLGSDYSLRIQICKDGVPLYMDSTVAAHCNLEPFATNGMTAHTHVYDSGIYVVEEASTCAYNGKGHEYCSVGDCLAITPVTLGLDASHHRYSGSEVTKNATSSAQGEYSYVCPDCGNALFARSFTASKCDVTGDDLVDIRDVNLLLNYLSRNVEYSALACGGDFNDDGICTVKDLTYMLLVESGDIEL